jgi:hypothetical protein
MYIIVAAVVVSVVCAIIGSLLLDRVGKAGVGLALGFFLGPVGVVVAAILRGEGLGDSRDGPEAEGRLPCPQCAELIMPNAKVCRFCGAGPLMRVDRDAPQ